MIVSASSREVQRELHRSSVPGGPQMHVTTYLGPSRARKDAVEEPPLGVLFPVAYLIEQDAGKITAPHFHQANQFQVFVDGSGSIGKHRIDGVVVHYASAYTPYGPIVPDAGGLSYLTMRNGYDPGTLRMPQERARLKASGRRPRTAVSAPVASPAASTGTTVEPILARTADGLAGWACTFAPGATYTGPDPRESGGQYWLVLDGELAASGRRLPRLSCLFLSPDEPGVTVVAGGDGCRALLLQFPDDAALWAAAPSHGMAR